jgi:hypothetical protein
MPLLPRDSVCFTRLSIFRKRGSVVGSFNELLADYFALCILMSRDWAEVKDLDRMAEIFAVPKPAMCIRLRQLSLIQQPYSGLPLTF